MCLYSVVVTANLNRFNRADAKDTFMKSGRKKEKQLPCCTLSRKKFHFPIHSTTASYKLYTAYPHNCILASYATSFAGCSIFENCKRCNNGTWGPQDNFFISGKYCAECRPGWSGGDCMSKYFYPYP